LHLLGTTEIVGKLWDLLVDDAIDFGGFFSGELAAFFSGERLNSFDLGLQGLNFLAQFNW